MAPLFNDSDEDDVSAQALIEMQQTEDNYSNNDQQFHAELDLMAAASSRQTKRVGKKDDTLLSEALGNIAGQFFV